MLDPKQFLNTANLKIPHAFSVPYIPQLDGLRGIAILLVIFSHIVLTTPLSKINFIGEYGVQIFFVLSGFLITSLLLKEKLKYGKVSLKNFYIRRVLRILPVAYLFLIVLVILNYIFRLDLSFLSFLTAALYIRNFHLNYIGNWFNGHFWTLSVEEQFYIIFPFLLVYSLQNYVRVSIIIILCIPLLIYLGFHNVSIFYTNYLIHKLLFLLINLLQDGTAFILMGSLFSILMFRGVLPRVNITSNRYLGILTLLLGLIIVSLSDHLGALYLGALMFAIMIASIIYITINNTTDILSRLLNVKLLIKLGILSYSIYIWQQLFLYKQPWGNSFKFSNSLALNLPMLFITAYLSYNFFELKFLKLKNRFQYSSLNKVVTNT